MRREGLFQVSNNAVGGLLADRGLALLIITFFLVFFAAFLPFRHEKALSGTTFTYKKTTTFEQLAPFVAMRDIAEEENIDCGTQYAFTQGKTVGQRIELGGDGEQYNDRANDAQHAEVTELLIGNNVGGTKIPSHWRRRPHRRQHRRKKTGSASSDENHNSGGDRSSMIYTTSIGNSDTDSLDDEKKTTLSASQRLWTQLHMMELLFSTKNNNLMHITERFLSNEQMYPIIYRCSLSTFQAVNEKVLLGASAAGLESSRYWSCSLCGKAHDIVRDSCLRCGRHGSPYAKLYFEQMLKSTDAAVHVMRLLHATHPNVAIHRVEVHPHVGGGKTASVSVHVAAAAAPEVVAKLNGNVFIDVTGGDGVSGVLAYYVYSSQRVWLEKFIAAERKRRGGPDATLPWRTLIVLREPEKVREKKSRRRSGGGCCGA